MKGSLRNTSSSKNSEICSDNLAHLIIHPTLGPLLKSQGGKDNPSNVDQLGRDFEYGEISTREIFQVSLWYGQYSYNAKADNGEGAGLSAHAPAESFHHRHLVCLSQLSARCKESIHQWNMRHGLKQFQYVTDQRNESVSDHWTFWDLQMNARLELIAIELTESIHCIAMFR